MEGYTFFSIFAHRLEEQFDFIVNLVGLSDGGSDLITQQRSKAFAESMGGDLDSPLGHPQVSGDLGVAGSCGFADEGDFQAFEKGGIAGTGVFFAE